MDDEGILPTEESAVVYRATIRESIAVLDGATPCIHCKGKGFIQRMSGRQECPDCSGTGDEDHPPIEDDDEESFNQFIENLRLRNLNE